jgi:hypothetical protein
MSTRMMGINAVTTLINNTEVAAARRAKAKFMVGK